MVVVVVVVVGRPSLPVGNRLGAGLLVVRVYQLNCVGFDGYEAERPSRVDPGATGVRALYRVVDPRDGHAVSAGRHWSTRRRSRSSPFPS